MTIGQRIRAARRRLGFSSVKSLATSSEVSEEKLSALEAGRTRAAIIENIVLPVSKALNTPVGDLVGECGWVYLPADLVEIALRDALSYPDVTKLNHPRLRDVAAQYGDWETLVRLLRDDPELFHIVEVHPQTFETIKDILDKRQQDASILRSPSRGA